MCNGLESGEFEEEGGEAVACGIEGLSGVCSECGTIFLKACIALPVEFIFDLPVAAIILQQLFCVGLFGCQAGNTVGYFRAFFACFLMDARAGNGEALHDGFPSMDGWHGAGDDGSLFLAAMRDGGRFAEGGDALDEQWCLRGKVTPWRRWWSL